MKATKEQFDLAKSVSRFLVPISTKISGKFKLLGSAVYVTNGELLFLITANHVIEDSNLSDIYIPFSNNYFLNIPYSSKLTIDHEEVDICIFALAKALELYTPVDYSLLRDLSNPHQEVLLTGFPASRSKSYNRSISFEQRFVLSWAIDNAGKFQVYNPTANTVCDFHQKNIWLGGGFRARFPDLWGMSGGAMFGLTEANERGLQEFTLSGIMTDWNEHKRQYIKCTNISIVCSGIERIVEEHKVRGSGEPIA